MGMRRRKDGLHRSRGLDHEMTISLEVEKETRVREVKVVHGQKVRAVVLLIEVTLQEAHKEIIQKALIEGGDIVVVVVVDLLRTLDPKIIIMLVEVDISTIHKMQVSVPILVNVNVIVIVPMKTVIKAEEVQTRAMEGTQEMLRATIRPQHFTFEEITYKRR